MKQLRVFLSYSSRDSLLCGQLKVALDHLGFQVFLAHEDINPSEKWQSRILEELRRADIFIPVLTRNFPRSDWTDQESGIAIEIGRAKILPLNIHLNPYGFLAKFQALKTTRSRFPTIGAQILSSLVPSLRQRYYKSLVGFLQKSSDLDPLLAVSLALRSAKSMTKSQANNILKACIANKRVFLYRGVRENFREFIRNNSKLLDQPLVAQFQAKLPK